jgi:hypothetical protein
VSVNCGHELACCSSLRSYMSVDSHGGKILTGEKQRTYKEQILMHSVNFYD